jgi:hypothetical protein
MSSVSASQVDVLRSCIPRLTTFYPTHLVMAPPDPTEGVIPLSAPVCQVDTNLFRLCLWPFQVLPGENSKPPCPNIELC